MASTPRAAQTAPALLDSAISAMQAQKSVHLDCTSLSASTGREAGSEDIGVASGRIADTFGDVSITDLLAGGVAYTSTNTAGILTTEGIPAAEAAKLAGGWIAIRPGQSYGKYLNYAMVTGALTLASQASGLRLGGTLKRTGSTVVQGAAVYGVSGHAPPFYSVTGNAPETVDIAASGAPLPVSLTANSGNGTVTTCHFSQWGEPLNLTAPAHPVPLTSIPGN